MNRPSGLDEHTRAALEAHIMWNTYLFVHGSAGRPTGYPMLAAYHNQALEFTTYRSAAKARRLKADPRACAIVRSRPDQPELALALWGTATEVTDDDHYLARATDDPGPIAVPTQMRSTVEDRLDRGKRMVFRMMIDRARFLTVPHRSPRECS
jgi:hypothetical protein